MTGPEGEIAVITDLLTILSKYDARTIGAARRRGGISDNLRTALDALAREAKVTGGHAEREIATPTPRPIHALDLPPDAPPAEVQRRLGEYLRDESQFPNKDALLSFAAQLKVPMDNTGRESRERVAAKLAKLVSRSKRWRERLNSALAPNQTSGYFDVILDHK